ncbi:YpmS family protein [uncultured Vagococcus sp.]|uniref:YpmS family protein n=1 Tax=uncultured Vagococcus sp. TaxID=189676 RepID=UPI0028D386F0|nr:YpmS family protein [uncultured Vagococcus sp.]
MKKDKINKQDDVDLVKATSTENGFKKLLKNPWKMAFLVLIGLLIGATVFLVSRMMTARESTYKPAEESVSNEQDATFQVQLKKHQVNQIISYYLNDFLKDSGVQYDFYLEDRALLNGTFKVLGYDMQFYLYFDPYVTEEGNIQLKATSISIGSLPLPISEIMKYVAKDFDVPKWVEVLPKEQTIVLHLDEFKLQNGMFVKAEKINLIDDDIRFNVYLPIDSNQTKKK